MGFRQNPPPTPNKERIRLLVEALRSGKYRQTRHKLARYDHQAKKKKYCCLGVACEIARLAGQDVKIQLDHDTDTYTFNDQTDTLPLSVMRWYGFRDTNPVVEHENLDPNRPRITLAELNDDYSRNFKQIADILEANYLKDEIHETDNSE